MSKAPDPHVKFVPAVEPGTPAHVFTLRRAAWRQAVDDWLADGRPDFLVVEPTLEPVTSNQTEGA